MDPLKLAAGAAYREAKAAQVGKGYLVGCPGQEVIGSMVIGSVGYNPKEYPIYK